MNNGLYGISKNRTYDTKYHILVESSSYAVTASYIANVAMVNPTTGYIPYNNAGTFADSHISQSGGIVTIGTSTQNVLGYDGYVRIWDGVYQPTNLQAPFGGFMINQNSIYNSGDGNIRYATNGYAQRIQMDPSVGQMVFYVASNGSAGNILSERIAIGIQNNGNVGIGKQYPNAKLDVSGSVIISGSLTVTGGITGSLFGTASVATSAPLYLPLAGGNLSGNVSAAGRLFTFQDLALGSGTTLGIITSDGGKPIYFRPNGISSNTTAVFWPSGGLTIKYAAGQLTQNTSLALDVSGAVGITGSLTVTQGITGSFSGSVVGYVPNTATSSMLSPYTLNSRTASFLTTGSQNINQTLSGSLTISENLIVLGSSSITFISSSTLNIGTNLITVNTINPTDRYGGLAVIDSGSSPLVSASFLYDSLQDEFIFVHKGTAAGAITSSHFLLGPETYNSLGDEIYLTANRIPKGKGNEHLNDSNITDNGSVVSINSNTEITGTLGISGILTVQNEITTPSGQYFKAFSDTSTELSWGIPFAPNIAVHSGIGTGPSGTSIANISTDNFGSALPIKYWNFNMDGTTTMPGGVAAPSFTGSFSGSVVGYVPNGATGSFVLNTQTGSFITNTQTGSMTVSSSSFATTASYIDPLFISASAAAAGFGSGGGGGVTSITAGDGISVNQTTGNVVITNTGGSGGISQGKVVAIATGMANLF